MATVPVGGPKKKPAQPSPFALQGKGGRSFNIPGDVWAGVPEADRAGLQDSFKRGGISALRAATQGKPWGSDLSQAIAGARGAAQNRPGARPAAGPPGGGGFAAEPGLPQKGAPEGLPQRTGTGQPMPPASPEGGPVLTGPNGEKIPTGQRALPGYGGGFDPNDPKTRYMDPAYQEFLKSKGYQMDPNVRYFQDPNNQWYEEYQKSKGAGADGGPAPTGPPVQAPPPTPLPGSEGGATGGAVQSPYLTMQGGKGGYSVKEWEGLKSFISQQDPKVQAQIYAGLDAVPGAGGQKFDFLLGQIKKFAGGGAGGGYDALPPGMVNLPPITGTLQGPGSVSPDTNPRGVPGQLPAPVPGGGGVPQGGITNNWKPNDPEWIKAMDAQRGPGFVQKVQQAMNEAVKGMPEDGSGKRRAAIYAVLQQFGMIPGASGDTQPPGPSPQQPPLGSGGQDPYQISPAVTGQTGAPPPIYTPPVLTQTQQGPQTQQVNPVTGLPNIFVPF